VDLDLGFQLDNASGELDQAQSQGIELHDAPGGALRHLRSNSAKFPDSRELPPA